MLPGAITNNSSYQKLSVSPAAPNHPTSNNYKRFFIGFLAILLTFVLVILFYEPDYDGYYEQERRDHVSLSQVLNPPVSLISNVNISNYQKIDNSYKKECNYWNCFNVYRCGRSHHGDHILIYVYPIRQYLNEENVPFNNIITKEFYQIIDAIIHSKYYTPDPHEACIFVPSIDVLNLKYVDTNNLSMVLQHLDQ